MTPKSLKPGWKVWRFDQMAHNVNVRIDDPSKSGVEFYVGLDHLDSDSLKIRRWGTPDEVESTKLCFKKGDIIFARRRAYQRKLGVAEFDGICSAHAMVLRAKPEVVLPEFLPFFMQSDLFMKRAVEISVGSLSPTINWKTMAIQEFALPPLEEQKRLLNILSSLNELVESEMSLVQSVDAVFSSTLLLKSESLAKTKTVLLSDLVDASRPITYGIVKPGLHFPGGIPVIKVKDYPDGAVITDDLLLTSPEIEMDYRRSRLKIGDILISIRGTVGRMATVPPGYDGAQITQDTARISVSEGYNVAFVRYMLLSPMAKQQIKSQTMGLAVQGINLADLRNVRIPDCDIGIQNEIAEALGGLDETRRSASNRLHEAMSLLENVRNISMEVTGDV